MLSSRTTLGAPCEQNIILKLVSKKIVFPDQMLTRVIDFSENSRKSLIFRNFRVENVTFCRKLVKPITRRGVLGRGYLARQTQIDYVLWEI